MKVKVHVKSNTLFKWDHCHDCYSSYSYGNGSCIELHPCDTSTSLSRTWFDMSIWRISAHQFCSGVANPAWLWDFWGTNPIGTEGGLVWKSFQSSTTNSAPQVCSETADMRKAFNERWCWLICSFLRLIFFFSSTDFFFSPTDFFIWLIMGHFNI